MVTLELKHAFRCPGDIKKSGLSQDHYITATFYIYEGNRPGDDILYRHAIGIARDAVRVPSLDHAWQLMPPKKRKKIFQQESADIAHVIAMRDIDADVDAVMSAMEAMVDEALVAARQRCIAADYHETDHDWWPDRHGPKIREIGALESKPAFAA